MYPQYLRRELVLTAVTESRVEGSCVCRNGSQSRCAGAFSSCADPRRRCARIAGGQVRDREQWLSVCCVSDCVPPEWTLVGAGWEFLYVQRPLPPAKLALA